MDSFKEYLRVLFHFLLVMIVVSMMEASHAHGEPTSEDLGNQIIENGYLSDFKQQF